MIVNLTKHNLINNIDLRFKQIKKKKFKIIIFLKNNLDSFLICKVIIAIFNSKFISCELLLINHQSEINRFLKNNYIQNQYFFFFINFGGNTNLRKFFLKNSHFLQKIFVIDFCEWFFKHNLLSPVIVIIINSLFINSRYGNFFTKFIFRKKKNSLIFFSNDFFNISQESDFHIYSNIWLEIIHISNMYFLGIIDKKKYNNFVFYISKKINFYFKKSDSQNSHNFLNKKSKRNNLKKTEDLSIFLLRHSSLLDALINTPSFSLKFRLWKYSGILKLSQLFIKLRISFTKTKQPWFTIRHIVKQNLTKNIAYHAKYFGVKLIKTCSFEKFFNCIKTYKVNKLYKISNIDFFLRFKINHL